MKLKDILNAGYTIKQGQVFTMKDCPPFKTPAQIAEESKKPIGPNSIGKGDTYKIDGTSDIVTIQYVKADSAGMYNVTVKFNKTGKTDKWYLEKNDKMFISVSVNETALGDFIYKTSSKLMPKHTALKFYTLFVKHNLNISEKPVRAYVERTLTNDKVKAEFYKLLSGVNEVTYRDFKSDPTMTSRQKVGTTIKEMNSLLFKMEQLIRQSSKLKNETGMDPSEYWGSTQLKLEKVTARVIKVARYLQELKKESDTSNS